MSHTRICHNSAECVVKSGVTVVNCCRHVPILKFSLRRPFVIDLSNYMHNDTMYKFTVKCV